MVHNTDGSYFDVVLVIHATTATSDEERNDSGFSEGCEGRDQACVRVYAHRAVLAAASGKLAAMIRFAVAQQSLSEQQSQSQSQTQVHAYSHSRAHSQSKSSSQSQLHLLSQSHPHPLPHPHTQSHGVDGPLELHLDPASGMDEHLVRELVWFAYTGTLAPPVPTLPVSPGAVPGVLPVVRSGVSSTPPVPTIPVSQVSLPGVLPGALSDLLPGVLPKPPVPTLPLQRDEAPRSATEGATSDNEDGTKEKAEKERENNGMSCAINEAEDEVADEAEGKKGKETENEAASGEGGGADKVVAEVEDNTRNQTGIEEEDEVVAEVERLLRLLWLADEYLSPGLVRACVRRLARCLEAAGPADRAPIAGEWVAAGGLLCVCVVMGGWL